MIYRHTLNRALYYAHIEEYKATGHHALLNLSIFNTTNMVERVIPCQGAHIIFNAEEATYLVIAMAKQKTKNWFNIHVFKPSALFHYLTNHLYERG